MAEIDAQDVATAGAASVTWTAAAAGGDDIEVGSRVLLLISNGDSVAHTATVVTPGTVRGIAIADPTVEVAASETAAVPMASVYRDPSTRRASVTMDDETSVELAAVKLPS